MGNSLRVNFVKLGRWGGVPIIMLHGWGLSLDSLRPLGELLSDLGEVYLLDLPGFGLSEAPESAWGTEDYALRVVQFLDEQGIEQGIFIGHSFGGKVILRLASKFPQRVCKAVLIGSSGLKPRRSLKRRFGIVWIKCLRGCVKFIDRLTGSKLFEGWFVPRYASPDYLNAGRLRQTFVKVVNEDLGSEAAKIKAQTLLLWGEKDAEAPLSIGQELNRLIVDSKLVVIPGAGHEPFAGSGSHLCAYYIRPFIGS